MTRRGVIEPEFNQAAHGDTFRGPRMTNSEHRSIDRAELVDEQEDDSRGIDKSHSIANIDKECKCQS